MTQTQQINKEGMKIVEVPIADLKPAEYNPRKLTDKQDKDLTDSIKEFGLVDPLIVNKHKGRENTVIGGHQRLKIASILGFKTIPVVYVDLEEKRERELNLRLNRNLGEWNYDLLANFSEEELNKVGFESEELDKIFNLEASEDDFDAEAEYEKIKEPKVKLGGLYQLEEHRLLCGDSTKKEDVEKLMGGEKADMVFTDPPYNIGYDYWDYLDTKEANEYKKWCENWFNDLTKLSPLIILTIGHWNMKMWFNIAKPLGVAVWIARNKTSGSRIAMFNIWEPILIYGKKVKRRGKSDIFDEFEVKSDVSVVNDVNEAIDFIKNNNDVFEINNIRQRNIGNHKCPKQVSLMREIINRYSDRENNILDIFGGSGSTLIACEQLNRKCFMMEIDEKYCEVIINRWQKLTNKKAKKL